MLDQLPIDARKFTFVDFGSGKGRTLILSALRNFKQTIGVEFSERLTKIAQANVKKLASSQVDNRSISVLQINALDFEIPNGPCVFYFYSPFRSPIIDQVLDKIRTEYHANPRPMFIIYLDYQVSELPIPHQLLNIQPFSKMASGNIPFDFANFEPLHFAIYSNQS